MDRIYTMALRIALSKTRRYGKDPNYLCFFPQKLEKKTGNDNYNELYPQA